MGNPPPNMVPNVDDAVIERIRCYLAQHSWLVVHVPQDAMCHTVGLTSYGLPELVVLGQRDDRLRTELDRWSARMVTGELPLGQLLVVQDLELREHAFPTRPYDIAARGGLWLARTMYKNRLRARELAVYACRCSPCRAGLYTAPDPAD
jgi:hypothetical protein